MVIVASALASVALCLFACVSVVLTVIDVRERRLPNRIVVPSSIGIIVLLSAAIGVAALAGDPAWELAGRGRASLTTTLGGAVVLGVAYLVLAMLSRGALGGGDVKLAPLIGGVLGYFGGWGTIIVGTLAAFALAGMLAVGLLALRHRRHQAPTIPFGPCMFAGAWLALVLEAVLHPHRGLILGVW